MIRTLHRWPGLIAAILLAIIALSGAALSVYPAMEAMKAPGATGISVAELASRVQATEPTVEQIRRAPSGKITAYFYKGDQPAAAIIDPQTGASLGAADFPALQRWLTNLHRSLFLGDGGRDRSSPRAPPPCLHSASPGSFSSPGVPVAGGNCSLPCAATVRDAVILRSPDCRFGA